jgi:hypothetical protein
MLTAATWAKYLAWVVLAVYVSYAFGAYQQEQAHYLFYANASFRSATFSEYMAQNLIYGICVIVEMVSIVFKGVVYFLVLKGISLGLNMIVETNLNSQMKGGEQ